jgi:hypothetical protein
MNATELFGEPLQFLDAGPIWRQAETDARRLIIAG